MVIATTGHGKLAMLWSSASGTYPTKIVLEQDGEDIHYGQPLSSTGMGGGKGRPAAGLNRVISEINNIRLGENSGGVVPTSWTATDTYHCSNGVVARKCWTST